MKFQSTQPSQAVTIISKLCDKSIDISIHTAFAGCDGDRHSKGYCRHISIHTAFAGCDAFHVILLSYDSIFQSTQPSQAVTANLTNFSSQISILLSHILHIPSNKSTPLHTFSLFFLLFLLLISVRMSWGFYVRLGFARWYAFGVAFFVCRRFPELLFVSSSSSGFGSIFENAGCCFFESSFILLLLNQINDSFSSPSTCG